MLDCLFCLVKPLQHGFVVKIELNAVYPVADSEPRVDDTLDESNRLLITVLCIFIVETCNWHENRTEGFSPNDEVMHGNSKFEIRVKIHFVKQVLEVLSFLEIIKQISVDGLVSQVNLKVLSLRHFVQVLVIVHLTLNQRQEAVANTQNREMLIRFFIVKLSPLQDSLNSFSVSILLMRRNQSSTVARNVESIQLLQSILQLLFSKSKVDRHNPCSSSFKELNVTCINVLFPFVHFLITTVFLLLHTLDL